MSWQDEIAKKIKALNKTKYSPSILGEVISVSPLKISVFGGAVILNENMLYRCKLLAEVNRITTGDKVLCIALDNYKTFVVVDRVVK